MTPPPSPRPGSNRGHPPTRALGNAPSHQNAADWIDKAIDLVAPHAPRVCLRGDTDFSLTAHLDARSERADFIFGMDNSTALRCRAEALPEQVPNGATDVYIEASTDANGIDTFKSVSSADFYASVQRSGHPGGLPAVQLGEVTFKNNTGNQVELFYKVPGQSQGKESRHRPVQDFRSRIRHAADHRRRQQNPEMELRLHRLPAQRPMGEGREPYTLLHVLGHNGKTMELILSDFIPAGSTLSEDVGVNWWVQLMVGDQGPVRGSGQGFGRRDRGALASPGAIVRS